MCNTSTAGVPTGTTKTVDGRLAFGGDGLLFGQMPTHRVPMMRTSRRSPASFSARRRAARRVSSFLGPYPPSSLLAHLPQSRMMATETDGHGFRVWCSPQPSTLCLWAAIRPRLLSRRTSGPATGSGPGEPCFSEFLWRSRSPQRLLHNSAPEPRSNEGLLSVPSAIADRRR